MQGDYNTLSTPLGVAIFCIVNYYWSIIESIKHKHIISPTGCGCGEDVAEV